MQPVYKTFRMALFSIALNANLASYTTAAVPHRLNSHLLVSSVQGSSVSKTLSSGSVSPIKRLVAIASGTSGVLNSGQALAPNQSLTSPSGQYSFVCQSDGNLVLYDNSTSLAYWTSPVVNTAISQCVMQSDGNLVIYRNSEAIWASNTVGNAGAYLQVQDDRNVVIYAANGQALWATNTPLNSSPVLKYVNNQNYYGTFSAPVFQNQIASIANQGGYIQNIAFTPQGGWVIVYTTSRPDLSLRYSFYGFNLPQEAVAQLNSIFSSYNVNFSDIKFAPQGGFIILANGVPYISTDAPPSLVNKFRALYNGLLPTTQSVISRIAFTPQGGILLLDGNRTIYYSANDISQPLSNLLTNISNVGGNIESLAFTPQGEIVTSITSNSNPYYYGNIPLSLANTIQALKPMVYAGVYSNAIGIRIVAFTPSGDWVLIAY